MDTLLIPLRSNAGWFQSPDTKSILEGRIKAAAVTHDQLLFQNGRYTVTVWERGSMDWLIGSNAMSIEERLQIRYHTPGGEVNLNVRSQESEVWHPLMNGPAIESLEVDFLPILSESGLLHEDFVRYEGYHPEEGWKTKVQQAAARDRRDHELVEALGVERFQQKPVLEALHFDSGLAAQLRYPFLTDGRIGRFIRKKNQQVIARIWHFDFRPALLGAMMDVVLPDFEAMSWEDVLKIRDSGSGRDLRRQLAHAAEELAEVLQEVDDPYELTAIVQKHYLRELADHIRAESPTVGKLILNLGTNLLPLAGAAMSGGLEAANLVDYKNSWIALIGRSKS